MLRQRIPEKLEHPRGHVRVADDVVLRAQQLLLAVAGKLDKDLVAVSDATFQIGFGNDEIIIASHVLAGGTMVLFSRKYPGRSKIGESQEARIDTAGGISSKEARRQASNRIDRANAISTPPGHHITTQPINHGIPEARYARTTSI